MYNNCNILYILHKNMTKNCDINIFYILFLFGYGLKVEFPLDDSVGLTKPLTCFFLFFLSSLVFRSADGASPAGGPEPLAAPRSLLPAAATLGHRQEVHGGLRDAGTGAARPDPRAGECDAPTRPPRPHLQHLSADCCCCLVFVGRLLRS